MMMTCEVVRELLSAYLDGETTPEETECIRAHLSVCPACRDELEELRDLSSVFQLQFEEYPDQLHENILSAVRKGRGKSAQGWFRRYQGVVFGVAAAILVFVLAMPMVLRMLPNRSKGDNALYPEFVSASSADQLGVCLYSVGKDVWESRQIGFAPQYRLSCMDDFAVLMIDGNVMTGTLRFEENGVGFLFLSNQWIYRMVPIESGVYLLILEA